MATSATASRRAWPSGTAGLNPAARFPTASLRPCSRPVATARRQRTSYHTAKIWYDRFNLIEACLWALVAIVIPVRAQPVARSQRAAVLLGSVAFLAFGVTDLLEIGCAGHIPGWLWAFKIACGTAIVAARYTYRGWRTFRWRDREFLFALAMLAAVIAVIALQRHAERQASVAATRQLTNDPGRLSSDPHAPARSRT